MKLLSTSIVILIFSACSARHNKLDTKILTIQLHYISWACECANWATAEDIDKFQDTGRLSDHSIFIEPANQYLTLPDTLGYSNDIVQFTGQFYIDKGFPKDYVKTEQDIDKAKIFRYTSFKIIKSNYRDFVIDKGN